MTCITKKMFETRAQAKKYARSKMFHGSLTRPYKCNECGFYHLTSYTAEQRQAIREYRALSGSVRGL